MVLGANYALALTGQMVGYVQYQVTISSPTNLFSPRTFTLNESARPAGQSGFIDLTLSLSSTVANLSYSRAVNASSLPIVFPYLSGLTNQSFSLQLRGITLKVNLVNIGQVPVTFNGASYQATRYLVSFSAKNASSVHSISADGSVVSMPSGLIYAVQLTLNRTAQVAITLLSTSLPLTEVPSSVNSVGASMLGAGAILAISIAAPTLFLRVKSTKPTGQTQVEESSQENRDKEKPNYWVD